MRLSCTGATLERVKSLMRVLAADPNQQIPCRDSLRKLMLRLLGSMNTHMQQSQHRHTHLPVHRGASPLAGSRVFQSRSVARNLQSHAQLKSSRTRLVVCAVAEAAQENKASAAEAEPVQQVAFHILPDESRLCMQEEEVRCCGLSGHHDSSA